MFSKFFQFTLALLLLSSCGPIIKLEPELNNTFSAIALAPIQNNNQIRDERVEIFRNLLEADLKNQGYLLLDRSIVNQICKEAECKDSAKLFEQYNINGLMKISLDSSSSANIGLLSRYALSGQAKIENQQGKTIYSVQSTASKTGGLILQSGQIIKAIKDLYISSADQTFLSISSQLAEDFSSSLPKQTSNNINQYTSMIKSVNKSKIATDFYKVCLEGTPNSIASILHSKEKTSLREVSAGRYCGSVFSSGENLDLELRTPYGLQAKSQLGI